VRSIEKRAVFTEREEEERQKKGGKKKGSNWKELFW